MELWDPTPGTSCSSAMSPHPHPPMAGLAFGEVAFFQNQMQSLASWAALLWAVFLWSLLTVLLTGSEWVLVSRPCGEQRASGGSLGLRVVRDQTLHTRSHGEARPAGGAPGRPVSQGPV